MCEMAQFLVKARAQTNSWLLPSYPGKVRLPADILRPLPSAEATNEVCLGPVELSVFFPDKSVVDSQNYLPACGSPYMDI